MTMATWIVPAMIGVTMAACASTGTVAYRERMALPADATLEVWIVDTSPGIGTMAILTQTTVAAQGRQVPLPFELQVDPSRVEQRRPYGLKAVIRAGGQMLFANTDAVPVLTLGHPSLVTLTLARVPQEAALADAAVPRP